MRHEMTAVIGGKRYNTQTATVIASDEYWDGSNYERRGTNTHLYRTKTAHISWATPRAGKDHGAILKRSTWRLRRCCMNSSPNMRRNMKRPSLAPSSKRHDRREYHFRPFPYERMVMHGESRTQRLVNPAEGIVHEVQSHSMSLIL